MGAPSTALPVKRSKRLIVELASNPEQILEAQALRYQVFGVEMGAKLKGGERGLDVDEFDPFCQHLLVRESGSGRVVGCTRILTDQDARRIGRFYSEDEFELGAIRALPGRLLEVGRTCIAREYRGGSGMAVLWSGLARFVHGHGFDYLFGCASVPLGERGTQAAAIMNRLRRQAMAEAGVRVTPRLPLPPIPVADDVLDAPLPPLLNAYVRLGAKACGAPCLDPDFGIADVLMLLNVRELDCTYARHFMERVSKCA